MELLHAMKRLVQELEVNPAYYEIVKSHIRTNFINTYAKKAINLPTEDFLFCPMEHDVVDIADESADSILLTLINHIKSSK